MWREVNSRPLLFITLCDYFRDIHFYLAMCWHSWICIIQTSHVSITIIYVEQNITMTIEMMNECRGENVWEITFDLRYSFEKIKLWIEERRITNSEDETRGTRQTSYKGISRKQKLAESFDFTFRYMDDVLSLKNSKVGDFFFWSHLSHWT
jgi:hypothetical protein